MGTTGRFGGSGGLSNRTVHTWYDTDYTELYLGLAVVLGFFIFLVLFLILMFGFIYLRRKCCLKQRPQQQRNQNMLEPNISSDLKYPVIITT